MSPFHSSRHVPATLPETVGGLEKLSVTLQIFTPIVVLQFQDFLGVGFSSHGLLDALQIKGLEGERVVSDMSIECRGTHQGHDDHVGESALERIANLVVKGVPCDVVGPDLASHCGVTDHLLSTIHVTHQFSVDRLVESYLTQVQFHVWIQTKGDGTSILNAPHGSGVEVQLDPYLHVGD